MGDVKLDDQVPMTARGTCDECGMEYKYIQEPGFVGSAGCGHMLKKMLEAKYGL